MMFRPSLPPSAAYVEGALKGQRVIQVACGLSHTLALTDRGTVYSWGGAFRGALGLGDFTDRFEPFEVKDLPPCGFVAASNVSLAVSKEYRQLYVWGENK